MQPQPPDAGGPKDGGNLRVLPRRPDPVWSMPIEDNEPQTSIDVSEIPLCEVCGRGYGMTPRLLPMVFYVVYPDTGERIGIVGVHANCVHKVVQMAQAVEAVRAAFEEG